MAEGVIADRAKGILPVTWTALQDDPRFGDDSLQAVIDTTKERTLGEVVDSEDEQLYPLVVIDYVAKLIALELTNPGIDYWLEQPISESTTGTEEHHAFTERVTALRELKKSLLEETRRLTNEVGPLIDFKRITRRPMAAINTLNDKFLTPSPQEFPRPYAETELS